MSKVARLVGSTYCSNYEHEAYYFSLIITPKLKATIKRLQKIAQDNDVYQISEFDYQVDIFTLAGDIELDDVSENLPTGAQIDALIESEDTGQRLDVCLLKVSQDGFTYDAILKHSSIQVESHRMTLDEVEQAENSTADFINVVE